jgi:transposase
MTMTTFPLLSTARVDTHLDVHVAAALDETGSLLGVESFATTTAGYRRLLSWLRGLGEVELVGIEGTAPIGAGLTRSVAGRRITVSPAFIAAFAVAP